jgi:hypothetical protein
MEAVSGLTGQKSSFKASMLRDERAIGRGSGLTVTCLILALLGRQQLQSRCAVDPAKLDDDFGGFVFLLRSRFGRRFHYVVKLIR